MFNAVVMADMFARTQNVFVYEDGNTVEVLHPTLDDMPNVLMSLNEKYNLEQISLVGAQKFLVGYQKKIEQAAVAKYGKNNLNLVIMKK